jgi:ElaB/YqjD/DUF883 family membrane-anchored ribosome-binding protein
VEGIVEMNKQTSDMGEQAADYLKDARASAVDAVADVADRADQAATRLGNVAVNFADKAKARLDNAADYVREFDVDAMVDDVKRYAKSNPVPMLLGALAVGFLAGRMLRRD